jgi:hypothetical protein
MSGGLLTGTIEEISGQAQEIVDTIAQGIFCQAQEWDGRIDCMSKMPDGSVIGEMILLSQATEARFRETAERLVKRRQGMDIPLQDELRPPIPLARENAAEVLGKILYGEDK